MSCEHLAGAGQPEPQSTEGCQDCLESGHDDWVHLRLCLDCGRVSCCDSSPRRHATAHSHSTGHPVIQSFQPGESWRWCYTDEQVG
ncbi:ubiquitin-hydrolase Zn-finger-containing protein [Micromonospora pisi]|uniref:Ubiquitin-hydrolase Zn-finger-containing protein n=1 Tax=Micromonospora pisi TaxID=589240 RepID=A0A495JR14_9ACTN|nr:UBP-type zinc finger domain-containing protein [Micromonospora pisi]RKR91430.1 ubiquitin-hydrolase Zn-finger-containing protein [Micromonospora pisi]